MPRPTDANVPDLFVVHIVDSQTGRTMAIAAVESDTEAAEIRNHVAREDGVDPGRYQINRQQRKSQLTREPTDGQPATPAATDAQGRAVAGPGQGDRR